MQLKKFKLLLSMGAALSATTIAGVAQTTPAKSTKPTTQVKPATPTKPATPKPLEKTGTKNIQVFDITPENQIRPQVHVIYDFDKYTVTKVIIGTDTIDVEGPVSLLKPHSQTF